MNFDSNRAWQEATAAVRASRSLIMPVAGVFFLIPSVATSFFLGDVQTEILSNLQKRDVLDAILAAEGGKILAITLVSLIAGLLGYLATIVLLTDHARPTVGEAIVRAARLLPTVIGATIAGYLVMFLLAAVISLVGGLLGLVLGTAGALLIFIALIVGLGALGARLSLTLPVVVVENVTNPVAALKRSWDLTRGNTWRLFGFYALLFIAYVVVAMIVMLVVGVFAGLLAGSGPKSDAVLIVVALVGGALSTVVAVLVSGVLAAIHRQLAGLTKYAVEDTFG